MALFTVDEQGHIRSFNAAAEKLLKYDADEVLGQDDVQVCSALGHGSAGSSGDAAR